MLEIPNHGAAWRNTPLVFVYVQTESILADGSERLVTSEAIGKPWCYPHGCDFAGMQNARVMGSVGLLHTFQMKELEASKCVEGLKSLLAT